MLSAKGLRVRSHKACARSACARPATVGWPRWACRTWRPPRPSTLIASQLGWPTVRSPRPASRALPPSQPEHFANGVRSYTDALWSAVQKVALWGFKQGLSFGQSFWTGPQAPSAQQSPQRTGLYEVDQFTSKKIQGHRHHRRNRAHKELAYTRWTSSHQRRYWRGQVRQHRHASRPIVMMMRRPARGGNEPSNKLRYPGGGAAKGA